MGRGAIMTTTDPRENNAKTKGRPTRRKPLTAAGLKALRLYEELRADRHARKEEAEKKAKELFDRVQEQVTKSVLDKIFRSEGEAVTRDETERRLGVQS